MKKIMLLVLLIVGLQACSGVEKFYRMDYENTVAYKFEEEYDINLFTPSFNYRRVSLCGIKEVDNTWVNDDGDTEHYTTHEAVEPCKPLYSKHGWGVDTAVPIAPTVLQSGGNIATGYVAGRAVERGLKGQNVSPGDNNVINNTNRQRQSQRQDQTSQGGQGGSGGNSCNGFCP